MTWIKRNLAVVISGVVALALLGFGGYYLWSGMNKNAAVDEEIQAAKAVLERLMNAEVFPSPSNVNQARLELERMNAFVAQTRKLFPPTPPPATPLNNQSFKSLLQTTVAKLNRQAEAAGVKTETNYYFTFEAQRPLVAFPAESLLPLSERLHDVETISSLLFQAKINVLEGVRRASVPGEVRAMDSGRATDYLNEAPRTNAETGMHLWPYEFSFQCFSPELATVLEGIMRLPDMVIVKAVIVRPAPELPKPPPPPPPEGRGIRGPVRPPPPALETILNERVLQVTLKLDVIKPTK